MDAGHRVPLFAARDIRSDETHGRVLDKLTHSSTEVWSLAFTTSPITKQSLACLSPHICPYLSTYLTYLNGLPTEFGTCPCKQGKHKEKKKEGKAGHTRARELLAGGAPHPPHRP